jgi:radical SAM protein with 4Fe4S-binding SPASM domain
MQKAILWGCGTYGEQAYPIISKQYDIVALCDNNAKLWGTVPSWCNSQMGEIVPPGDIVQKYGTEIVVLIFSGAYEPISAQAEQMGLTNIKVWVPKIKNAVTFSTSQGFDLSEFFTLIKDDTPSMLKVGLSDICNIRCRYCPFQSEHKLLDFQHVNLSWESLKEIVKQVKELPFQFESLSLSNEGEVFCNREWFEMASFLMDETKIKKIVIYTNGMLLNDENIRKLAALNYESLMLEFSIDGVCPEDTEHWRKGSKYSVIRENIIKAYNALKSKANTQIFIGNSQIMPSDYSYYASWAEIKVQLAKNIQWLKDDFPFAGVFTRNAIPYGTKLDDLEFGTCNNMACTPCTNLFSYIAIAATGDISDCPCGMRTQSIGNVMQGNFYDQWKNHVQMKRWRDFLVKGIKAERCMDCFAMPGFYPYYKYK